VRPASRDTTESGNRGRHVRACRALAVIGERGGTDVRAPRDREGGGQ
jgi:hypothetical protein